MESRKPWTNSDRPCAGVLILIGQRAYALPWGQFVVAHGDDLSISAEWITHRVTFRGGGLMELLGDISSQVVERVNVSARADQFLSGPLIEAVEIEEIED